MIALMGPPGYVRLAMGIALVASISGGTSARRRRPSGLAWDRVLAVGGATVLAAIGIANGVGGWGPFWSAGWRLGLVH